MSTPEPRPLPEPHALLPVGGLHPVPSLRRLRGDGRDLLPRPPVPQSEVETARLCEADRRNDDSARLERLLDALVAAASASFAAFVARFDFTRHRSFADIGGATGLLSCLVAERNPQIACHSCDLPIVRPIAEQRIRARGLAGRVRAETIDFLADELPAASLIAMGVILHDWNVQRKKMLIAKAHRALPQGGAMVAIECFPDPDRDRDAGGVVVAPGGIVEFGDAFSLTGADFIRWCAEAGFARCEVLPLAGAARATVAYK